MAVEYWLSQKDDFVNVFVGRKSGKKKGQEWLSERRLDTERILLNADGCIGAFDRVVDGFHDRKETSSLLIAHQFLTCRMCVAGVQRPESRSAFGAWPRFKTPQFSLTDKPEAISGFSENDKRT